MACFRSLLLFFFLTSAFIAFASAGEKTLFQTSGEESAGEALSLVRGERERILADEQVNTTLILAANRTQRKDPLDSFHKYKGGWNISDRHYWASVVYTTVHFYDVAAIWFVIFGLSLTITSTCYCYWRREHYGYSRLTYALSLIFLTFFTVAAIVGCIILYTGQEKFHSSTINTLESLVFQADTISESLRNVSGYLAAAKQINVDQVILPPNVQGDIDRIQTKINSSASTLSSKTEDNSKKIKDLIQSVRLALIILSAVMLLLTFLGFVFSIFGMQVLVYLLVVPVWILVIGTFVLCGIFLLLHNATGDTCVAMNQWVQNPTARTALDDILPCVDNATAQETLTKSKEVTTQLVTLMNTVITNISNMNYPPNFGPLYYNQSGPLLPKVCNPFNPDLSNRTCAPGEVELNNATEVLNGYICQVSNGICTTTGRLTPTIYTQMAASVNVSYGLYKYGPFLVNVQDCSFVRQTFSEIETTYCPGLRKYSKWIYVGLVMVALAVMLSLVFWVIYGRERRHRVYTKAHTPHEAPSEDKHA